MKIKGVNLGNWLVLEKWMNPALFEGTTAEDEYYLPRQLSPEVYEARIKIHRSEYITERDFITIKRMGLDSVRIPVPYFIFGDREPFIGCIEELDKAFNWAEKYGLTILIDLHTVPLSQNGFDNGGLSGICKWAQNPDEVEFVLGVLERLAKRYGERKGLMGIQPLNEPITEKMWNTMDVQHRYPPVDAELAEGSAPITMEFLRKFYLDAYDCISRYMPKEKYVVIEDVHEQVEVDGRHLRNEQLVRGAHLFCELGIGLPAVLRGLFTPAHTTPRSISCSVSCLRGAAGCGAAGPSCSSAANMLRRRMLTAPRQPISSILIWV